VIRRHHFIGLVDLAAAALVSVLTQAQAGSLLTLVAVGILVPASSLAQVLVRPPAPDAEARRPPGEAAFGQACAECHGANGEGGRAPSLLGPDFQHGGDGESLANSIRRGYPPNMPPFEATLSAAQINSVVDFLQRNAKGPTGPALIPDAQGRTRRGSYAVQIPTGVVHTSVHDFRVESVAKVGDPYALDFLPDGRLLITEIMGRLRIVDKGHLLPDPVVGAPTGDITGMPQPQKRPLLSIAVHPDYEKNGWIYLLHAKAATSAVPETTNLATITRGRLRDGHWVDRQDIFSVPTQKTNSLRMKFDSKGYLYVGTPYDRSDHPIADSFAKYEGPGTDWPSQDLANPMGKIFRIKDDGSVPADNPFVNTHGADPFVFSYGHREVMGLAFDAQGELWQSEDGPRGGDEVNHIKKGHNYGWPLITWGHAYQARPLIPYTEAEGMEQPVVSWAPSPAVSDIEYYSGEAFPRWRGSFFVGSMKQRDLFRMTVDGDRVTLVETVVHDLHRIRDIATGPEGFVYLLTDGGDLVRLVPDTAATRSLGEIR
jgi:glucose/arabinose dehydrogenase